MSELLPPPVTEARFRELEGATREQVKKRAGPYVRDLRAFLNRGSCLSDIQRIRRGWRPRSKARLAFEGDEFPSNRERWYIYNTGGRNEAQFNVGLSTVLLRVGLGFEFTRKAHGKPEDVQRAYNQFRTVVGRYRKGFDRFAHENSLQVEWRAQGAVHRQYVSTRELSEWLLYGSETFDWVFVGRLLYRGKDAAILEDPMQLKDVMESVFGSFKPLWQQAQAHAA